MKRPRAYTIEQLTKRSGFDRRTIAYYTSIGLLPKVGRRGPRTTYPPGVLHRLLIVRRVRKLQQQGRLSGVTLGDMTAHLGVLDDTTLARLAGSDTPDAEVETLFSGKAPAREVAPDARRYAIRKSQGSFVGRHRHVADAGWSADDGDDTTAVQLRDELTTLLNEVDERAKTRPSDEATGETLYRVPITDEVLLTVRNIDRKDATLVERMAALLRRLTQRGGD